VDAAPYVPRSRSRETTFQQDLRDWQEVRSEVARLARLVAADVAASSGRWPGGGEGALRAVPDRTHGRPLAVPGRPRRGCDRAGALAALDLFTAGRPVRLLGVRAEFVR